MFSWLFGTPSVKVSVEPEPIPASIAIRECVRLGATRYMIATAHGEGKAIYAILDVSRNPTDTWPSRLFMELIPNEWSHEIYFVEKLDDTIPPSFRGVFPLSTWPGIYGYFKERQ